MEISKEKPKNLWKILDYEKYEDYATISSIDSIAEPEEADERVVYMEDLEKRKQAYGICGECGEPGTGENWCQPCNSKRFKNNFKNWTSGNKEIDELIQKSQLDALHHTKCLEWIEYDKFTNIKYIAEGNLGKFYSAEWPEGCINNWDIENQKWYNASNIQVALKSSNYFSNEIESHFLIYSLDIVQCFGVTQDPKTKDYMLVLSYCEKGNLKKYLYNSENYLTYESKIFILFQIIRGLLDLHNAGRVHRDLHLGNILLNKNGYPYIGNLGRCQSANKKSEEVIGIMTYMAPEVLQEQQYTKAADIYSFGIIMNELLSEEIPYYNYDDLSYDFFLIFRISNGLRPRISEDTPKLFADLIKKCWDDKPENRPTAKELYQIFIEWNYEKYFSITEINSQIEECEIRKNISKNSPNKDDSQSYSSDTFSDSLDINNIDIDINNI